MSFANGPQGSSGVLHNSMATRLVARVEVKTPVAAVSVDNLPQHYRNLAVMFLAAGAGSSGSVEVYLNFNDDAGSGKYAHARILRTGGSPSSTASGSDTKIICGYAPTFNDFIFGPTQLWIPGYASDYYQKALYSQSAAYASGGPTVAVSFGGGNWLDQTPITKLTFTNASPVNWRIGTTISVYGEP